MGITETIFKILKWVSISVFSIFIGQLLKVWGRAIWWDNQIKDTKGRKKSNPPYSWTTWCFVFYNFSKIMQGKFKTSPEWTLKGACYNTKKLKLCTSSTREKINKLFWCDVLWQLDKNLLLDQAAWVFFMEVLRKKADIKKI